VSPFAPRKGLFSSTAAVNCFRAPPHPDRSLTESILIWGFACTCWVPMSVATRNPKIAECDVGHYSDFGCFRDTIARHLDAAHLPTLMKHSDCDGEWTLSARIGELERLEWLIFGGPSVTDDGPMAV
jgi:hypothetical protein